MLDIPVLKRIKEIHSTNHEGTASLDAKTVIHVVDYEIIQKWIPILENLMVVKFKTNKSMGKCKTAPHRQCPGATKWRLADKTSYTIQQYRYSIKRFNHVSGVGNTPTSTQSRLMSYTYLLQSGGATPTRNDEV